MQELHHTDHNKKLAFDLTFLAKKEVDNVLAEGNLIGRGGPLLPEWMCKYPELFNL